MAIGDSLRAWLTTLFRGSNAVHGTRGDHRDAEPPVGRRRANESLRDVSVTDDPRDDGDAEDVGDAGLPIVDLPIGDEIDLHAFNPRDIRDLVDTYLYEAQRLGYREVRVVHGKGKGVQRRIVRALLDEHPAVRSYRQADHTRGSWGATLVDLHPPTPNDPADADG